MKIHAPVTDFKGTVAGVEFVDGVAEVDKDQASALAYFRRHGYGIGEKAETPEVSEPPDPRDVTTEKVGSPLRDAAVDPRKADFLPPINAGKANPHGPEVVAPHVHGAEDRRITPGKVDVEDTDAQEAKETAHTVATVQGEGGDRTEHVEAFLDRNADEVIADVDSLTDQDRSAAIQAEEAGKGRVTVLRALRGEG